MTQYEVHNLARQADGQVTMWVNHSTIQKTTTFTFESPIDYRVSGDYPETYHIKFLERFANIVVAKEREACAKVAYDYTVKVSLPNFYDSAEYVAQAIRARGKA